MKQHSLLFVGDSITDVEQRNDPEQLGFGYVRLVHDILCTKQPNQVPHIVNRGIGGDTIRHLEKRWHADVLALKPNCLCVSIGVNDVWRHVQDLPNPEAVPLDEFAAAYRRLLRLTRDHLPACHLFICEPTPIGEEPDTPPNEMMKTYLNEVHAIASEANATLVPMNQAFWRAKLAQPSRMCTTDGVHPASHGHMLMALTFLEAWEAAQ